MKKIRNVIVDVEYEEDGYVYHDINEYNNTQDAQSHLQTQKCYNKERRHQ